MFSIAEKKQRADLFQECENVQLRDICGRAALSASFSRDYKDTDYMSLSDCSLHIYISCTECPYDPSDENQSVNGDKICRI